VEVKEIKKETDKSVGKSINAPKVIKEEVKIEKSKLRSKELISENEPKDTGNNSGLKINFVNEKRVSLTPENGPKNTGNN
jgi:hypothetical protein